MGQGSLGFCPDLFIPVFDLLIALTLKFMLSLRIYFLFLVYSCFGLVSWEMVLFWRSEVILEFFVCLNFLQRELAVSSGTEFPWWPRLRNLAKWDWVSIFLQNKYGGECRHGRTISFCSVLSFPASKHQEKVFMNFFNGISGGMMYEQFMGDFTFRDSASRQVQLFISSVNFTSDHSAPSLIFFR